MRASAFALSVAAAMLGSLMSWAGEPPAADGERSAVHGLSRSLRQADSNETAPSRALATLALKSRFHAVRVLAVSAFASYCERGADAETAQRGFCVDLGESARDVRAVEALSEVAARSADLYVRDAAISELIDTMRLTRSHDAAGQPVAATLAAAKLSELRARLERSGPTDPDARMAAGRILLAMQPPAAVLSQQ